MTATGSTVIITDGHLFAIVNPYHEMILLPGLQKGSQRRDRVTVGPEWVENIPNATTGLC